MLLLKTTECRYINKNIPYMDGMGFVDSMYFLFGFGGFSYIFIYVRLPHPKGFMKYCTCIYHIFQPNPGNIFQSHPAKRDTLHLVSGFNSI